MLTRLLKRLGLAKSPRLPVRYSPPRAYCEICDGHAVYLCPKCYKPIASHSHENDFICAKHSFVNPIRQQDGATIDGGGVCGRVQVLATRRQKIREAIR